MKKTTLALAIFLSFCLSKNEGLLRAQATTILSFTGTTNGSTPWGSLISDGTFLYGMTSIGGANNQGTIFKIMPDGTGYVDLFDFADTATGSNPWGSLLFDGTFMYGMTIFDGANYEGTVFKIMPDGTGFTKLLDFQDTINGTSGYSTLVSDGTFLYGTTVQGGINGMGNIFKIMPDGSGVLNLFDFAGITNGIFPYGDLFFDGTFLYGMTFNGGANDFGTIYKIMPDGTGFINLLDFDSATNGSNPTGSLISDGTFLYGMTGLGGANNYGTVFKIMPDGSGYVNLLNFDSASNGSLPRGSLLLDGGFLYGTTETGGLYNKGTLFKIMTDGSGYVMLNDFAGMPDGMNPYGSLFSDGTFLYGTTVQGGANDLGSVFKFQYCTPTDIYGHVTYTGGNVTNGFALIYPYDTAYATFDTLQIQPLDAAGNYHFTNVVSGNYLIKIFNDTLAYPTLTSTYFGDQWVWDSAAVFVHDCIGNDTADVHMIELNLGGGFGLFHGQIIEGYGYGRAPGDPIQGIDVKLGITGTTQLVASTVTDVNGNYTFGNKPYGNYTIYVDIPGLERDSSHVFTANAINNQFLCLDYIVDSVAIYPLPCTSGNDAILTDPHNLNIYPNPFRENATIEYSIHRDMYVTIDIYNVLGLKVKSIMNSQQSEGKYQYNFKNLNNELRSGVYFISLSAGGRTSIKRMVMMD